MTILMFALIIVVFYFFMIRPQMKRQKELRKFQEALKMGDKVIIAGGVYGKISEVKDDYVMVEISDNINVKVAKSTIILMFPIFKPNSYNLDESIAGFSLGQRILHLLP